MRPLSDNDIESELSYAYLHAVAAKAGMGCRMTDRHEDNHGVDAQITAWGKWPLTCIEEVTLNVQLKATQKQPADDGTSLSYFLHGAERANHLRSESVAIPRFLVVLFLPQDARDWLRHSPAELVLRRCAYWVSLRGATPPESKTGWTVRLPKRQMFHPAELTNLVEQVAQGHFPKYEVA